MHGSVDLANVALAQHTRLYPPRSGLAVLQTAANGDLKSNAIWAITALYTKWQRVRSPTSSSTTVLACPRMQDTCFRRGVRYDISTIVLQ